MIIASSGGRRSRYLALGVAALALAAAAATAALVVVNHYPLTRLDAADPSSIFTPPGLAIFGLLIAWRLPRNPTGWLLLASALIIAMVGLEDQYARLALVTHPGLPGAAWGEWLNGWTWALVEPTGTYALLLLVLPDGHLPSPRWRWLVGLLALWVVVVGLLLALAPGPMRGTSLQPLDNPVGLEALKGFAESDFAGQLIGVLFLVGYVLLVAAAVGLFVRMRRSRGDQRQQLKWIAYAVVATAIANLVASVTPGVSDIASTVVDIIGFGLVVPSAVAVAIFKHRLYDIDVVISRTLVYGSLAVFITAVYVGIAVGIGTVVGGGGKPNLGLSILATAIVAVGFQPVRERVQRVANRLVYGKRATPYEVLSQFSERVAESYAVDEVMPRMARVLAEGTGAQRADVWLRNGERWHEAAVWPQDATAARDMAVIESVLPPLNGASRLVEVRHQGNLLGALSVTKRPGEQLTPVEDGLLTDLAGQAGLVMRNVGLTSDLQARIVELRASRQRLVTAQDQERRKLERNLHDGAQQHLVALKVKLGLVDLLMGRDPEKAKATLAQLKGDADEALETLRDLARGIYPPLLADKGLVVALESQARKATVPVTVEAERVERYPQDVEAAVYFCCLEALQNVQKYAKASLVVIRLRGDGGQLHFEVQDDGAGFDMATVRRGSGLSNMVDRLDALGGSVDITSAPGRGSTLRGSLPVAAEAETAA